MPDLTPDVEAMTAAEYRSHLSCPPVTALGKRILAALEERERLLGEREAGKPKGLVTADEYAKMLRGEQEIFGSDVLAALRYHEANATDASLGALVRRIAELAPSAFLTWDTTPYRFRLYADGLQSALDSPLPKEPEVVTGVSGWTYRRSKVRDVAQSRGDGEWHAWDADDPSIPPCDAPVVAALMAGGGK